MKQSIDRCQKQHDQEQWCWKTLRRNFDNGSSKVFADQSRQPVSIVDTNDARNDEDQVSSVAHDGSGRMCLENVIKTKECVEAKHRPQEGLVTQRVLWWTIRVQVNDEHRQS